MNNKLQKFSLLYEEVIKELTVPVDTFDYKFQLNDDDTIVCSFQSLNADGELVTINITIPPDSTDKIVEVSNGNTIEKISQKKLMMLYYKDYQKFKIALKEFEKELEEQEQKKLEAEKTTSLDQIKHTDVPQIIPFNQKLKKQNLYTEIKEKNMTFTFALVKNQKVKDMAKSIFSFMNTSRKLDNSPKFQVTALIKLEQPQAAITRMELNGQESEQPHVITAQEFKNNFPDIFEKFDKAVSKYNKGYMNSK